MMRKTVSFVIVFVAVCIGILIGWLCRGNHAPDINVVTKTDTLTIRDTITERYPIYVTRTKTDTMLVQIRDTVTVHDTSYVVLDREQKHYRNEDYEAWVSGYRPALDSIYVFPETRYVTETVQVTRKPTRWGIGIQGGYGVALPDGRPQLAPYVGVGISYNFVEF